MANKLTITIMGNDDPSETDQDERLTFARLVQLVASELQVPSFYGRPIEDPVNGNILGRWDIEPADGAGDSIEANELEVPGGPPKLFQPQQNTLIDGWIPFIFDETGAVNYSTREEAQVEIDEFISEHTLPQYLPEEFRVAFIAESCGDTLEHAELLGWKDIYPDASDPNWDGNMADGIEESAIEFIESQGLVVIHPEV